MTHKTFSKQALLRQPNGSIEGLRGQTVFGWNSDISAGVEEDIWDVGGIWVAPTDARSHELASTSADDAAAGIGARAVLVEGLDLNFAEITELVVLDGLTPVATEQNFARINSMRVPAGQFGSSGFNAGDITATALVDDTSSALILATAGRSLSTVYTVPAGKTAYFENQGGSVNKASAGPPAECLLHLLVREGADASGCGWTTAWVYGVVHSGTSVVGQDISPGGPVPEKTDMRICAVDITGANLNVSAWYGLILDDD